MRQGLTALVVSLGAAAALAGGLEIAARRRRPDSIPAYARYLADAQAPFFEPADGPEGPAWRQRARHPFYGLGLGQRQTFPARKRRGRMRVIVVGESSAGLLAGRLAPAGGGRLEVVDMSVGGATLEHVKRRADEALRYEPDTLVLLFGNNLAHTEGRSLTSVGRWIARLPSLALVERAQALLQRRAGPGQHGPRPQDSRVRLLRRALEDVVAECRRSGVRVVLCTVPSNLRAAPAEGDRAALAAAAERHRIGRRADGTALAAEAARRDDALLHYVAGEWLLESGAVPEGRGELVLARDREPRWERATSATNRTIREVGRLQGAEVVDLARWLESRAPRGVPGWESFPDQAHTFPELRQLEAEAVASRLLGVPVPRDAGFVGPGGAWLLEFPAASARGLDPEAALLQWAAVAEGGPGLRDPERSLTSLPAAEAAQAWAGVALARWRADDRAGAWRALERSERLAAWDGARRLRRRFSALR